MSDTVDQRVVSMQFDNAAFERGVQQTLNSLNTLNQTVERTGQTNSGSFDKLVGGLTQVEREVHHGVLPAMDAMTNKFSFFGTIADQAIRNITNSMMDFGHKAISSIFQVQGGMNEYELKMGSIQTILNGTGESLTNVKSKLEELNKYSDDTIYSFKDMTDNIGKFTNQGVKLDNAVNAIKGIANEAARSGANAQQASHAMYNFSQALSSGYVKLIDWKSIENAQMATMEFKQTLLDTATALGTVVKHGDKYITTTTNMQGKTSDLFNAQKGFNDSLQNQWLTSDVLTQALEVYATDIRDLTDAEKKEYEAKLKSKGFTDEQIRSFEELGQKAADAAKDVKTFSMLVDTAMEAIGSGWAQTFEIIFGDFYEAKSLWTYINTNILDPMISKFSDVRNNMLKVWKDAGGRTEILHAFVNSLNAIHSILHPIAQGFSDVFGALDGKILADLSKNLADFTYGLIGTNGQMNDLRNKARVVFTVLKNILDVLIEFRGPLITLWALAKVFATIQTISLAGFGLKSLLGILKIILLLGLVAKVTKLGIVLNSIGSIISKINNNPIFKTIKNFTVGSLTLLVKKIVELYSYLEKRGVIDTVTNKIIFLKDKVFELFNRLNTHLTDIKISDIISDLKNILPTIKNIGSSILGFFTSTRTAAKETASSFETITQPVKKSVGLWDEFSAKIGNIAGSMNMVAYAAETAAKPTYIMSEGLVNVAKGVEEVGETVEEATKPTSEWEEILTNLVDKMDDISPALSPITNAIRDFINNTNNLSPTMKKVVDVIGNFIAKVKWSKVVAFGIIFSYIQWIKNLNKSVAGLGNTINTFGNHFDNLFGTIGGSVKEFLSTLSNTAISVQGFFNAMAAQYKKTNFRNTAYGILALAGAFGILAASMEYLDEDSLKNAAIALAILTAAVVGINAAMAGLSTVVNPAGMVALMGSFLILNTTLLSMAASLLAIGTAVVALRKALGSVEKAVNAIFLTLELFGVIAGSALKGLGLLSLMFGLIGQFAAQIGLGVGAVVGMSVAMIAFNAALIATAASLTVLTPFIAALIFGLKFLFSAITDGLGLFIRNVRLFGTIPGLFMSILHSIAPFIVMIATIKAGTIALKIIAADLLTAGVMMGVGATAFGTGLLIMVTGLTALSPMIAAVIIGFKMLIKHITDGLGEFIKKIRLIHTIPGALMSILHAIAPIASMIALLIVTFLGVMVSLKAINILMKQVSGSMLKLAASVALLGIAMHLWSGIEPNQLLNTGIAMVSMMAGMALVLKMLDKVNVGKIAGAIIALVVALYMLTPLAALYGLAWDTIGVGLGIIALGLLAIGGSIKLMENANAGKILAASLAISVLVTALTYLATILSSEFKDDTEHMTQALYAMLSMIVAFTAMTVTISQTADSIKSIAKMAGMIAIFGGVVFGLVIALSALAAFPAEQLLVTAESLSMAMGAFSASMVLLSIAGNLMSNANIGSMVAMMLSFSIAMKIMLSAMENLNGVDTASMITFFVSAGGALLVLSGAAILLGQAAEAAVVGIAIFLATILLVSAALIGAGYAFKLWAQGLNLILSAVSAFLPVFIQFLHKLADLSNRANDIIKTSGAITRFSKSLIDFAVGIGATGGAALVLGGGLLVASAGLTAFSLALGASVLALTLFGATVATIVKIVGDALNPADQWGTHMVENFAAGIVAGIPKVTEAVLGVVKQITGYLKHTSPIWGPLANFAEKTWGIHLDENFADGILSSSGIVGSAAKSVAQAALDGLSSNSDLATTIGNIFGIKFGNGMKETIKNTLSQIQSAMGKMNSLPLSNSYKAQFGKDQAEFKKASVGGQLGNNKYTLAKSQIASTIMAEKSAKAFTNKYSDVIEDESKKNNAFGFDSLIPDVNKQIEDIKKSLTTDDVPSAGGAGGGSGSGGKGGGSGSGSSKEAEEAAKKATEAEKQHAKYLEISTKVAKQYDAVYENLNDTVGDTKPSENAQNAIKALAEDLYKASLTGNETEEELAKMAENTEKAFIEMYENIKKKISDSLDFTKEFDKGFSNIIKPKQLMKNLTSQITGNIDMTKMWKELAMRGTPTTLMKELIEKGSEAQSEIRTMLQLTGDEYKKYIAAWNEKDSFAEFAANEAVASMALAGQINKLREASKAQKEYVAEGQKLINDWNSIQNDGSLASQASYDILAKQMEELAKKYGVSVEQIQKACKEVADGTKNSVAVQLEQFDKLDAAYNKWVNGFNEAKDRYLSGMGDFLTSFSEFKTEEDDEDKLTVDKFIENLKTRSEALKQWNSDIHTLISMQFNQEKLNELVAAGPESSYQIIHTLAEASEEEIDEINGYLDSAQETISNSAISYGQATAKSIVDGFDATFTPYFESLGTKFDLSDLLAKAGLDLEALGTQLGFGVKNGIESSTTEVQNSTTYMAEGVDNAAGKYINHENGFDKAANFMIGLLDGIEEYKDDLLESIEDVCSAVGEEPYDAWDEGSPSKLTRKYAKWYIQGMVGGFKYYGTSAINAVKDNIVDPVIGNLRNALTTAYDLLVNEDDFQPTITPVLDLSDIESGRRSLASLMSTGGMNINANVGKINTPASKMDSFLKSLNSKNVAQNPTGNNFNFVQNNYSPKALSRLEIYRQTKNQFAQMKGLVNK